MTFILKELDAFLQPHKSGLHGMVPMRWGPSYIQVIHMSEQDVTQAAQAVRISSGEISDIFLWEPLNLNHSPEVESYGFQTILNPPFKAGKKSNTS